MGQFPWRHTLALPCRPERILVATERCIEYTALSTGCKARRAFLIGLGVMTRFTARPGCVARRTLRGTSNLEKKPTSAPSDPIHGTPYFPQSLLLSVPGRAHGAAYRHGDQRTRGRSVQVDLRVARAVGFIAPRVTIRASRRLAVGLVGMHIDVVLVLLGVVDAGGGPA